ncbi:MAG: hypothetical protein GY913_10495 [Proteobacteria bacterium]|nr:hypothetical protein [Pseudomonadota bacterium]MCP4917342.1 hypothetical protein [Pseudomonadota bacterium]
MAAKDSDWFPTGLMVNYRVDDLAALLDQLREAGIAIAGGPESHSNGTFAWEE